MQAKSIIDCCNDSEYVEYHDFFRGLIGYEQCYTFYNPHKDSINLFEYLKEQFGYPMDEEYAEFMNITNGMKTKEITFFSFKHDEQDKDLLFVNFDKTTRDKLNVKKSSFIAGMFCDCALIYDKAPVFGEEGEYYKWGMYKCETSSFIISFYNFIDLLDFLISFVSPEDDDDEDIFASSENYNND